MTSAYYKRGQLRADADADDPRAFAVCDRCQRLTNLRKLRWQMQWNATSQFNTRFLVCDACYDQPQAQLRMVIPPPDPQFLKDTRPENFRYAEVDFLTTQDDQHIVTQDGDPIVVNEASAEFPD